MNLLLLDHVWQSTIVLAVIGLLTLFFRNNGAHVRHALWMAASLKFLLPFALLNAAGHAFAGLLAAPPVQPKVVQAAFAATQPFSDGPVFVALPAPNAYALPVMIAWVGGMLAVAGYWLWRWLGLRATLRAATQADIGAPMPVRMSATLLEPGLIGIFRPVLLLPRGIADRLAPAELQSIIAHEACHLRRRDNLTAALHMLVEILFWFWPPVWWLGTRLVAEREKACDEAVLAAGSDPEVYATSILKVCKHYVSSPLACAAGVSGADLKQRMEDIMRNTIIARLNIPKRALLAASAATALALPLAMGVFTAPTAMAQASGPHSGTEAVLRRILAGAQTGKPDIAEMGPELQQVTKDHDMLAANAQKWGSLKSLTFRGNDGNNDIYIAEFDHALIGFTIGPVADGKVSTLFFGPSVKRLDNGPSPGLAAAIRRELEGSYSGTPAYEVMSPTLQNATRQQWDAISGTAKELGPVQAVTFQKIDSRGWDVYQATFANGTATVSAEPLQDGKMNGLIHRDFLLPHASQHPGSEAWLRRYIAAVSKGAPNYDEMGPGLLKAAQQQWPQQQALFQSLGALRSLSFQGGAGHGADLYLATYQNGTVQWGLSAPDASGKVENLFFHRLT